MSQQGSINTTRIKVIGVGGGGCNVVNRAFLEGIEDVSVYAVDTDFQHLSALSVPNKIQIGERVARGLSAEAKPEVGEQAVLEDIDKIKGVIGATDMLILVVGLGGGAGTGAAPVIAQTAKEMGVLTVAVVTLPFDFEGPKRMKVAREGLDKLKDNVDTCIVIHNQTLKEISNKVLTLSDAFLEVDDILSKVVRGITNIISASALIGLDFMEVRMVMENGGLAHIGEGKGEGKVDIAVEQAITSPFLEGKPINSAKKMLVTIWLGEDSHFNELEQAMDAVTEKIPHDTLIVFGAVPEEGKNDFIRVTLIAMGFDKTEGVYQLKTKL